MPHAETGWAFQREMELHVESGLSPMETIEAATWNNARFFRAADWIGSLEPGKRADLVLVERNPAEDIAAMRDVVRVMLGGQWVEPAQQAAGRSSNSATACRQTASQTGRPGAGMTLREATSRRGLLCGGATLAVATLPLLFTGLAQQEAWAGDWNEKDFPIEGASLQKGWADEEMNAETWRAVRQPMLSLTGPSGRDRVGGVARGGQRQRDNPSGAITLRARP